MDYSGSTLNLAARLMDLARPEGVVIDGHFGINLLTPAMRKKFVEDRVYLNGIAPNTGTRVYSTKDLTTIPERAKKPVNIVAWGSGAVEMSRRQWTENIGRYVISLDAVPKNPNTITCFVKQDKVTKSGRRRKGHWTRIVLDRDDFAYELGPSGPTVVVRMPKVHELLERMGGGPTMPAEVRAEFVAE